MSKDIVVAVCGMVHVPHYQPTYVHHEQQLLFYNQGKSRTLLDDPLNKNR